MPAYLLWLSLQWLFYIGNHVLLDLVFRDRPAPTALQVHLLCTDVALCATVSLFFSRASFSSALIEQTTSFLRSFAHVLPSASLFHPLYQLRLLLPSKSQLNAKHLGAHSRSVLSPCPRTAQLSTWHRAGECACWLLLSPLPSRSTAFAFSLTASMRAAEQVFQDCAEIQRRGANTSGVYIIHVANMTEPKKVREILGSENIIGGLLDNSPNNLESLSKIWVSKEDGITPSSWALSPIRSQTWV